MSTSSSGKTLFYLLLSLCLLGGVLLGGFYVYEFVFNPPYTTAVVEKGLVQDTVAFSGNIEPKKRVSLGFEKSGRVVFLPFVVGNYVTPHQILAVLSTSETEAILNQVRADVRAQASVLKELQKGTRQESINVAQTKVASAKEQLVRTKGTLIDTLTDAYAKADDAVRTTLDPLFIDGSTNDPRLVYSVSDDQLGQRLKSERIAAESTLAKWKVLQQLGYHLSDGYDTSDVELVGQYLDSISKLLDDATRALSLTPANPPPGKTSPDVVKAAVTVARGNIGAAQVALAGAKERFTSGQSAISLAEQELKLLQAGSTAETVEAQQARLDAASAKLPQYQNELEKNYLRAPFAGVIAAQNVEEGEVVLPQETVISFISTSTLEIRANVSELDVAKLHVGDRAKITLDAYGPTVSYDAVVTRIDPAETMVDNSPTYGIRLEFLNGDIRLRPGMTTNVRITASERAGVLFAPLRAISYEKGTAYATVLNAFRGTKRTPVTLGLTGSNGMVEIKSGVSLGEKLIVGAE
jgi:RND family efflux transporter MFP subunit